MSLNAISTDLLHVTLFQLWMNLAGPLNTFLSGLS